jgi:catechol-2,3-dioxygenase
MEVSDMPQPRVSISHIGLRAVNVDKLVDFYRRIFGFEISDKDDRMTFMTADPTDHHQLFIVRGRKEEETETRLAHVAFRVHDMDMLREIGRKLADEPGVSEIRETTHGNAWSIYFRDPEGNGAEAFVDTPWHVAQPFAKPSEILNQSDQSLHEATDKLLDEYPSKTSFEAWQKAMSKKLGME